jgi:hypothetical protein
VATNEAGVVMTEAPCLMLRAVKAIDNAAVPELVETAKSTPQYSANSSSNFRTLSPRTNRSFRKASTAAVSISLLKIGLARGIATVCSSLEIEEYSTLVATD